MIACVRIVGAAPDGALAALVQEFSPRFELVRPDLAIVDVGGLDRLVGNAHDIGTALGRLADARGLRTVVALAPTRTAALLLALGTCSRLTIAGPGDEQSSVAPFPLDVLAALPFDSLSARPLNSLSAQPHGLPVNGVLSDSRTRPAPARRSSRGAGGSGFHYRLAPVPASESSASDRSEVPRPSGRTAPAAPVDDELEDLLQTLARWGLTTLGEFAALPPVDLFERLGASGVAWQAVARGRDLRPLVRTTIEEPFEASMTLDWPIDALEPLSFVLGRLLDPLCTRLDRRCAGASAIQVTLQLVSRTLHVRTLPLPAPMRDARVLRTLALLDLESHPPDAAIDRVTVTLEAVPGRIVQYGLLTRALPVPEQMATLTARLSAVMGEGRVGAPTVVDSYRPGAFGLQRFTGEGAASRPMSGAVPEIQDRPPAGIVAAAIRRLRPPIPARVTTRGGRPVRVALTHSVLRGGVVVQAAGPWRTSGEWWTGTGSDRLADPEQVQRPWDHDEWDIVVTSGAVLRLSRDRVSGRWQIDALVD
jgi:protein ImuB